MAKMKILDLQIGNKILNKSNKSNTKSVSPIFRQRKYDVCKESMSTKLKRLFHFKIFTEETKNV